MLRKKRNFTVNLPQVHAVFGILWRGGLYSPPNKIINYKTQSLHPFLVNWCPKLVRDMFKKLYFCSPARFSLQITMKLKYLYKQMSTSNLSSALWDGQNLSQWQSNRPKLSTFKIQELYLNAIDARFQWIWKLKIWRRIVFKAWNTGILAQPESA